MKKDKNGRKLYKRVIVHVELPGQKPERVMFIAPIKQGFNPGGIDDLLEQMADRLAIKYPMLEHRLVQFDANHFKFILEGIKFRPESVSPLLSEVATGAETP